MDRSTLYRFRQQCGLNQVGNFLNDDELDGMIEEISTGMPNTGIKSLENIIKAKNFTVPRQQLRGSVHRVDPEGVARRRLGKLERKVYNVEGPDHLWHLDGHHKLIKWGFVTHGCIDGFTRFITYLKCSTNNKSKTVLQLFQQAIEVNNVPSRVRGDRGGENVLVADKMIELRGVGRNSYLGEWSF